MKWEEWVANSEYNTEGGSLSSTDLGDLIAIGSGFVADSDGKFITKEEPIEANYAYSANTYNAPGKI